MKDNTKSWIRNFARLNFYKIIITLIFIISLSLWYYNVPFFSIPISIGDVGFTAPNPLLLWLPLFVALIVLTPIKVHWVFLLSFAMMLVAYYYLISCMLYQLFRKDLRKKAKSSQRRISLVILSIILVLTISLILFTPLLREKSTEIISKKDVETIKKSLLQGESFMLSPSTALVGKKESVKVYYGIKNRYSDRRSYLMVIKPDAGLDLFYDKGVFTLDGRGSMMSNFIIINAGVEDNTIINVTIFEKPAYGDITREYAKKSFVMRVK